MQTQTNIWFVPLYTQNNVRLIVYILYLEVDLILAILLSPFELPGRRSVVWVSLGQGYKKGAKVALRLGTAAATGIWIIE